MKKFALLLALLMGGCLEDPTASQIKIAQELDLTMMSGRVFSAWQGHFRNDHAEIGVRAGDTWYAVNIERQPENESSQVMFYGLKRDVWNRLIPGTVLPLRQENPPEQRLAIPDIAKLEGSILDMAFDPTERTWTIVVGHEKDIATYRVTPHAYYALNRGMRLPFPYAEPPAP